MQELYRDRYTGFTVKHFHEQLVKRHNYVLGYPTTAFCDTTPLMHEIRRDGLEL